jgi:hypothetical protein
LRRRSKREQAASPFSLDQSLAQSGPPAEPGFEAGHAPIVTLVIIAKEVKKAMQGQNTKFGLQRMTCVGGLTPRYSRRNDDIAQLGHSTLHPAWSRASPRLLRWKREDIGCAVFMAERSIQHAHAAIRDNRHGHLSPSAGGRRRRKPLREPSDLHRDWSNNVDRQPFRPCGSHRW